MSGHMVNGTPVMNYAQPSTLFPHKSDLNNTSSLPSSSNVNKRKASRPSPNLPSEPKKQRVQSPVLSSAMEGNNIIYMQMSVSFTMPSALHEFTRLLDLQVLH